MVMVCCLCCVYSREKEELGDPGMAGDCIGGHLPVLSFSYIEFRADAVFIKVEVDFCGLCDYNGGEAARRDMHRSFGSNKKRKQVYV